MLIAVQAEESPGSGKGWDGKAGRVRLGLLQCGRQQADGGWFQPWALVKTLVGMVWARQKDPGRWGAGSCPQPGRVTGSSPGLVAQPGWGAV